MFIGAMMISPGRVVGMFPIVCQQAGGCTRDELPQENDVRLRAAAARERGGSPHNYFRCSAVRFWESREAARICMGIDEA